MGAKERGKHAKPTPVFTDGIARARSVVSTTSAILAIGVGATVLGLATHDSLPNLQPSAPTSSDVETQTPDSSAPSPSATGATPSPTTSTDPSPTPAPTSTAPRESSPKPSPSTTTATDGPGGSPPHEPGTPPTEPPGKAK
jgi:hypothetical protein